MGDVDNDPVALELGDTLPAELCKSAFGERARRELIFVVPAEGEHLDPTLGKFPDPLELSAEHRAPLHREDGVTFSGDKLPVVADQLLLYMQLLLKKSALAQEVVPGVLPAQIVGNPAGKRLHPSVAGAASFEVDCQTVGTELLLEPQAFINGITV